MAFVWEFSNTYRGDSGPVIDSYKYVFVYALYLVLIFMKIKLLSAITDKHELVSDCINTKYQVML